MKIFPLSALRDNYIWTIAQGPACVVVDPGEARPVLDYLGKSGRALSSILITHAHEDHKAGVAELVEKTGASVFGPRSARLTEVDRPLADEALVELPGLEIPARVLAVPGHTPEHLAYLIGKALFCGDTLFGAGCGRLLGGTAEELHASLQRLAGLSANTLVYSAHEYTLTNLRFARHVEPENTAIPERQARCERLRQDGRPTLPSTLEEELATNPFLRTDQAAIRQACEAHAGARLDDEAAVFKALRRWKDDY